MSESDRALGIYLLQLLEKGPLSREEMINAFNSTVSAESIRQIISDLLKKERIITIHPKKPDLYGEIYQLTDKMSR